MARVTRVLFVAEEVVRLVQADEALGMQGSRKELGCVLDFDDIVERGVQDDPSRADVLIHLLGVSRHLERIADHASNIAEDVIYFVEGRIVRHKIEEYLSARDHGS